MRVPAGLVAALFRQVDDLASGAGRPADCSGGEGGGPIGSFPRPRKPGMPLRRTGTSQMKSATTTTAAMSS